MQPEQPDTTSVVDRSPTSEPATAGPSTTAAAVAALAGWLPGWIDLRRRMLRVPGVQVSIRVGTELLFSSASGTADAERGIALTPDHLFRIASHSKTFAATACLVLKERGGLRLDDTVGHWVPELADTALADLTVRALLGHQAGVIRDGADCDYWQLTRDFPDRETLLTALRADGVTFAPDVHFKYSNYGFSIVGLIVERAAGVPFNAFVRREILDVLGLPRLHPDVDGVPETELAVGHSMRLDGDDEQFVLRNPSTEAMSAATGFVACADDLTAYAAAHLPGDERLVSDAGKRLMQRTESIVEVDGVEKGRYGLGLELHTLGKRHTVGHSGGFPGFVTRTFVDPADRLVLSVLTNQSGGPAHEIAVAIVGLVDLAIRMAGGGPEIPPVAAGVDPASFTARLVHAFGYVDIVALAGRLVMLYPAAPDPAAEPTFLEVLDADTARIMPVAGFASAGEMIRMSRDPDGTILGATIGGMQAWPVDVFRARRRRQLARPTEVGPEDS